MTRKRTICVATGSRADYGLLRSLLRAIAADADLRLQVLVTGMHLSPAFGDTWRDIEADGFALSARVDMLEPGDTALATATSLGRGVIGSAEALQQLAPDMLVVLGDRFEMLAVAQAALVLRIPLAHLHGGELSEGAFDESIRHAITKMAQWHFVAAEPYRARVVQMGERPERVFNVGAPGLDALDGMDWLDRAALERELGLALRAPLLLVTWHPETLSAAAPVEAVDELLAALEAIPEATLVLTYPNADAGGRALIERIQRFVQADPARRCAAASLGHRRYLSLLRVADAVVGNSSSGLTEAPALKVATVNIGDRQHGRMKAASVIDTAARRADIEAGIRRALSPQFRASLPATRSLYGQGGAGARIKDILKTVPLAVRKPFHDLAAGG
jgi:UDP-hydrolysing UDP-N-acetyl-D-glucosamine 2-epimerase